MLSWLRLWITYLRQSGAVGHRMAILRLPQYPWSNPEEYCWMDRGNHWAHIIDDLKQDCSNSITNALELLQCCAKPLICRHSGIKQIKTTCIFYGLYNVRCGITWWRHQMEHFPRYWPFVRGIHRSPVNSRTKASHAELWCFLWSASE